MPGEKRQRDTLGLLTGNKGLCEEQLSHAAKDVCRQATSVLIACLVPVHLSNSTTAPRAQLRLELQRSAENVL
jgi:hypothetical protein